MEKLKTVGAESKGDCKWPKITFPNAKIKVKRGEITEVLAEIKLNANRIKRGSGNPESPQILNFWKMKNKRITGKPF